LKKSFQTAVITLDKSDRLERTELSQNPQRRIAHR
jgi:hypothetical protein